MRPYNQLPVRMPFNCPHFADEETENHIIWDLLCLASFTEHRVFKAYPCCSVSLPGDGHPDSISTIGASAVLQTLCHAGIFPGSLVFKVDVL